MPLSLEQIKLVLQNPTNRSEIREAKIHEGRVRMHSEVTITQGTNVAVTEFLKWVESLLPAYKAFLFKNLFRFPVKSVSLTSQMFEALKKLFDGRDLTRVISMKNPSNHQDQMAYFERIKFSDTWKKKSFNTFKRKFNSIMVCDLPREQSENGLPEPFWYMLPISNVIDFELVDNHCEEFKWLLFHSSKDRVSYFDNEVMQVFIMKDGQPIGIEMTAKHDLGRTMARFFMSEELSEDKPAQKVSPLSTELSKLDWFLFHEISKNHLDLYASYPIYWGVEEDCNYEDALQGLKCDGGFLASTGEGAYSLDRAYGSLAPCPSCHDSRLNGAGSYNSVPLPDNKDEPFALPPVGVVESDTGSLKYNVNEHIRLRLELYTNVTGYGGDLKTDQAVNEKQVAASFDTRASVLKGWKSQFEKAEKWLILTLCELRYGPGSVSNLVIDYGTEFYLSTPQELLKQYREGVGTDSHIVLSLLEDQYYETRHRNNPDHMFRISILQALEPLRHATRDEVKDMYLQNLIEYNEYYLKINFSTLISRFERENTDVTNFGSALDFSGKVDAIKKTLLSYVKQPKQRPEPAASAEAS